MKPHPLTLLIGSPWNVNTGKRKIANERPNSKYDHDDGVIEFMENP